MQIAFILIHHKLLLILVGGLHRSSIFVQHNNLIFLHEYLTFNFEDLLIFNASLFFWIICSLSFWDVRASLLYRILLLGLLFPYVLLPRWYWIASTMFRNLCLQWLLSIINKSQHSYSWKIILLCHYLLNL